MKLLFERSRAGRGSTLLPPCDVPAVEFDASLLRSAAPKLPEISEIDLGRHYTEMAKQTHGVNDGFYPLGSCTMKYNPRVNEEMAALPGFTQVHPCQPLETVQGSLEVLYTIEQYLSEITGMDGVTLQPAAGAHGEYTGLLLIRHYHLSRGDTARTKIIVPDSAHGTNPASATMAGFKVVSVPSNEQGGVDLDALRKAVGPDTAGLMLTNPNTVGLFDQNILEITGIIHEAGGLCYYDGANLNAVMGVVRPGDMGFDCIHSNLHKTFATPHGGGGPGAGAVGCKSFLRKYMPGPLVVEKDGKLDFEYPEKSIGRVKMFYGNFDVVIKALTYVLTLGREGIPDAAKCAVLNANYMMARLKTKFDMAFDEYCLQTLGPGEDCFYLWRNSPSVIIGMNQNAYGEVNIPYLEEHGINLVRRVTGGGAGGHDLQNLNYTIVGRSRDLDRDYPGYMNFVINALRGLGVPAELSGRNDIMVEGRKVSGYAKRVFKDRLMVHGTLMFDVNLEHLTAALAVPGSKLEASGIESVRSRVANLKDYLPQFSSVQEMQTALQDILAGGDEEICLNDSQKTEIQRICDEKFSTWEWNFGKSPKASFHSSRKFGCGTVEASWSIVHGTVDSLVFSGDFLGNLPSGQLAASLNGLRYDRETISSALDNEPVGRFFDGITADGLVDLLFS